MDGNTAHHLVAMGAAMTPGGDGIFDPQRAVELVAAFAGAIISLFVHPDVGRWQAIGIVCTGLIVVYFGNRYIAGFLPPGEGVRDISAVLLGGLSFAIAGRLIAFARRGRLPLIGKGGRDDGK